MNRQLKTTDRQQKDGETDKQQRDGETDRRKGEGVEMGRGARRGVWETDKDGCGNAEY